MIRQVKQEQGLSTNKLLLLEASNIGRNRGNTKNFHSRRNTMNMVCIKKRGHTRRSHSRNWSRIESSYARKRGYMRQPSITKSSHIRKRGHTRSSNSRDMGSHQKQ
jgi:hypothetical protein